MMSVPMSLEPCMAETNVFWILLLLSQILLFFFRILPFSPEHLIGKENVVAAMGANTKHGMDA